MKVKKSENPNNGTDSPQMEIFGLNPKGEYPMLPLPQTRNWEMLDRVIHTGATDSVDPVPRVQGTISSLR